MRNLKLDRRAGGAADPGAVTDSSETVGSTDAGPATTLRVETSSIVHDPQMLLAGPQGLEGYQLVVLGRDAEAFLSPAVLERLRTWISRDGGSLICYRGTPVAQVPADLARLMPVRWTPARESRFRVKLTDRGNDLSWLNPGQAAEDEVFNRMPSLATTAPADSSSPSRSCSPDPRPTRDLQS